MAIDADSNKLENEISELNKTVVDLRIEQAEHKGSIKDLMEWRTQFTRMMNDTVNTMNSKLEKEMSDMGKSISGLNDKLDRNNKDMNDKIDSNNKEILKEIKENAKTQEMFIKSVVKIGISLIITVLLTGCGWMAEALIFHK